MRRCRGIRIWWEKKAGASSGTCMRASMGRGLRIVVGECRGVSRGVAPSARVGSSLLPANSFRCLKRRGLRWHLRSDVAQCRQRGVARIAGVHAGRGLQAGGYKLGAWRDVGWWEEAAGAV